jgi:Domain of unknown function (DUF4394)
MKKSLRLTSAVALLLAAASTESKAALAYTIEGNTLYRFDTATPTAVTAVGAFSGFTAVVDGIDFRPANGVLYGYSQISNAIVTIDVSNAVTSFASTPSTASSTFDLGIDFNPAADRLRLVNLDDQNLRINVDTGATIVDGPLAYAAADPFFGVNPNIKDAAYTNNDNNPATGTTLYYIDIGTNSLVTTSTPNAGTLTTVGSLGVNPNDLLGFDIITDPFTGVNSAFAILDTGVASGFYTINLATGAATLVSGTVPNGFFGLAVTPTAVPEPGTALAGLVAFGLCATRRRRAAKA